MSNRIGQVVRGMGELLPGYSGQTALQIVICIVDKIQGVGRDTGDVRGLYRQLTGDDVEIDRPVRGRVCDQGTGFDICEDGSGEVLLGHFIGMEVTGEYDVEAAVGKGASMGSVDYRDR